MLEIVLERLAAHEGDDGPRGVVAARLVPAGDQFLEHLAEHFRVDGHLDVERRGLGDGEVVALEQVQHGGERLVRDGDRALNVVVVFEVEQSAVEEWHLAAAFDQIDVGVEGCIFHQRVQAGEKGPVEAVVEKVLFRRAGSVSDRCFAFRFSFLPFLEPTGR